MYLIVNLSFFILCPNEAVANKDVTKSKCALFMGDVVSRREDKKNAAGGRILYIEDEFTLRASGLFERLSWHLRYNRRTRPFCPSHRAGKFR